MGSKMRPKYKIKPVKKKKKLDGLNTYQFDVEDLTLGQCVNAFIMVSFSRTRLVVLQILRKIEWKN